MQVNSPPIPGSPAISTYRDPGNTDVPPGITTSGVPAQKLTVKEIQTQDKDAPSEESNLNLACIGNCAYSALIDEKGTVVWSCFPRFDGDPIFCSLLKKSTSGTGSIGFFDIQMTQLENSEQHYMEILVYSEPLSMDQMAFWKSSTLHLASKASKGNTGILVVAFPLLRFRPTMFIRMLTPLKGRPRARIRLRPTFGYGWGAPEKTRGSNHIRYLLSNNTIRLTTNAPIAYIVDEVLFEIDEPLYLILMPDESLKVPLNEMTQSYLQKTLAFWTRWTETLSVPLEWQQEYIRACITLKMSSYEETGAIIAAMTTSIPSIPNGLKHDLRYCWLRDAMYTTRILNRIGATTMMERYLKYLTNFVADFTAAQEGETERRIQSVYGISLETRLHPREMHRLPGYRGMGPVIIGTEDAETIQNDVYGSVILALTQVYFDKRLVTQGDLVLFEKLQVLGEMAAKLAYKPDYGPKGRQTHMERHTYSVAMCWAACDRLAKISWKLKQADRAKYWLQHADKIHEDIMKNAWNEELNSLVSRVNTKVVDSYLLLLPELGFIDANDAKFVATVAHIEKTVLREDKFIVSASNTDVVKNNGTFWYIKILALQGHKDKARQLFENMLKHLNNAGIISETMFLRTQELWGNFPHNNALVGLIDCALTLSEDWSNLHSTRFSMKEMKSQPQK